MSWARLLKRVFDLDVERCGQCSGKMGIIAAIEEPAVIERILTHLGLSAQPPPRALARRVDLFQETCFSEADWFLAESMARLGLRACRRAELGEIGRCEAQIPGKTARLERIFTRLTLLRASDRAPIGEKWRLK